MIMIAIRKVSWRDSQRFGRSGAGRKPNLPTKRCELGEMQIAIAL